MAKDFSTDVSQADGATVIHVRGEIDIASCGRLRDGLGSHHGLVERLCCGPCSLECREQGPVWRSGRLHCRQMADLLAHNANLPTYVHRDDAEQLSETDLPLPVAIGDGMVWSDSLRYRVVDIWISHDQHGFLDIARHVFLERVPSAEGDRPPMNPEYYPAPPHSGDL
jgi:hypothetical protein